MADRELGATLVVTRSRLMLNARVLTVTTLGLALVAAAALPGGSARADERRPALPSIGAPATPDGSSRRDVAPLWEPTAEGPFLATGGQDPAAWDIPGELIVDAKDDLDAPSILSLARDYGLRFVPTALEAETKEEIAEVPVGQMAEVIERLSHDPRVEIVE